jgi:hypothetical protein
VTNKAYDDMSSIAATSHSLDTLGHIKKKHKYLVT